MIVRKVVGPFGSMAFMISYSGRSAAELEEHLQYVGARGAVFCSLLRMGEWGGFHGVFQEMPWSTGDEYVGPMRYETALGWAQLVRWTWVDGRPDTVWLGLGGRYGRRVDADKYAVGDDSY